MARMLHRIASTCFALAMLAACSTTPLGVVASVDAERDSGARTNPAFLARGGGLYDNPAIEAYVNDIAARLLIHAELPEGYGAVQVGLLDTAVPNAYTVPGGGIYVSRGMVALADNEAELAGAIAHEISRHIARRRAAMEQFVSDIAKGVESGMRGGGSRARRIAILEAGVQARIEELSAFSRGQELEADRLAAVLLEEAGYAPVAFATLLRRIDAWQELTLREAGRDPLAEADADAGVPAIYPDMSVRVAALGGEDAGDAPIDGAARDRLMQLIDGVPFDDAYQGGYIRDGRYWHPALGFAVDMPDGFLPTHDGSLLLTSARGTIRVHLIRDPAISLESLAETIQGADMRRDADRGFDTLSAMVTQNVGDQPLVAAIRYVDLGEGAILGMVLTMRGADVETLGPRHAAMADSIERVDPATMPPRRRYVTRRAAQGETLATLTAPDMQGEAMLRLLNDLAPGEAPLPGNWVKSLR